MSDYTRGYEGATLDAAGAIITGADFDDEFDLIQTAVNSKADSDSPTLVSPVLNTSVSGTAVLDEDTMVSNSDTKLATQQSIKAYVDASTTSLGLGQTWQNFTASRSLSTTYTNDTGRSIQISVNFLGSVGSYSGGLIYCPYVSGAADEKIAYVGITGDPTFVTYTNLTAIIPPGVSYRAGSVNGSSLYTWFELR